MDSLPSPLRKKRDHPRWSNRHEDLKRTASSSLDREFSLRQNSPDHDLAGDGEGSTISRLDKARNFAKKDVMARNGVSPPLSDAERSDNPRNFSSKRTTVHQTLRSPVQKSSNSRHEHKPDPAVKVETDAFSGRSPDKISGLGALRHCTSPATGKLGFKHDLKASRGDTTSSPQGKEHFVNKDCKKIVKLLPRNTSSTESFEASADASSRGGNEGKFAVPKGVKASPDEVSWKSKAHAKAHEGQKIHAPPEQRAEKKVLETPVAFLHVTRRARSERRRDDSSKSQSSKGVSLDGFGTELEEALLKKQETEVNSAVQPVAESKDGIGDKGDGDMVSQCKVEDCSREEREEGELEPEDDLLKVDCIETAKDVGKCASDDVQVEGRIDEDLGDGKVAAHHPEGCKVERICINHDLDVLQYREDQGHELNTSCKPEAVSTHRVKEVDGSLLTQQKTDALPLIAMEMEVSNVLHTPSSSANMHTQQYPAADVSGDKRDQVTLSLYMQSAGKALEDGNFKMHRQADLNSHTNRKKSEGGLFMQVDNGGKKGLSEEVDELSVYSHKQKKLKLSSLQLSLALPGSSMASGKSLPPRLMGPAEAEKSLQSLSHVRSLSRFQTETFSDGFNTSLSLSSFVHNPSCSLNCMSLEDQELSCGGSRQISQGRWQSVGGNERGSIDVNKSVTSFSKERPKHKFEAPLYQEALKNGQLPSCGGNRSSGSNQVTQRNPIGMTAREPRHGVSSSQERVQNLVSQAPRESMDEPPSLGNRFSTERSKDIVEVRNPPAEKIGLHEISSEPVAAMAQKLQELPDSFLEGLKGLVKELLGSFAKRDEFLSLQQIIRRRTDLTEEALLRAHQTQLEILVALKMGMESYVQKSSKMLTYKALIEIFLQTRCRNVDCQQILPVDGCECKVCSQKIGFCHQCMCMVCSKFDSDSSTSRWVGCDICMHWCHTDCALRMSHINPARVPQGRGAGPSEMQYQCLSCGHFMELYGFVKGVFHNFAASWGSEALAKELDCVRKIFHGSEDVRGKQLRWKAEKMLQMLENDVASNDVCSRMLRYFNEDSIERDRAGPPSPKKVQPKEALKENEDAVNGFETTGFLAARKAGGVDKVGNEVQVLDRELEGRRMGAADLQNERDRNVEVEDLHSIIQVKLADVVMFQARADAARQDATNLQHILSSKAKKIEDDFTLKYARLRLDEAEGRRRKRLEELQALERSQHDYEIMKIRIESDMKNLMMKMEMQKPQPA